jgi:hypothetical protein
VVWEGRGREAPPYPDFGEPRTKPDAQFRIIGMYGTRLVNGSKDSEGKTKERGIIAIRGQAAAETLRALPCTPLGLNVGVAAGSLDKASGRWCSPIARSWACFVTRDSGKIVSPSTA